MCIYTCVSCWTLRLLFKNDLTPLDFIYLGSNRGQNGHYCCVHFNMGNYVKTRKFTRNRQRIPHKTIKSIKAKWRLQKDTQQAAECQCTLLLGKTQYSGKVGRGLQNWEIWRKVEWEWLFPGPCNTSMKDAGRQYDINSRKTQRN